MPHTYTKRPPGAQPTTNAERIRRYRERQKAKGKVRISGLYLDQSALDLLAPLCRTYRYPPNDRVRGYELSAFLNQHAGDILAALRPEKKARYRK